MLSSSMLLSLLLACKGGVEDTNDAPPLRNDDTAPECKGADPVIQGVSLSNGGIVDFEGTDYPTIRIAADTTDADGNLNYVTMELWYSEFGAPNTDAASQTDKTFSIDPTECAVDAYVFALNLQVGTGLAYGTEYTIAVRVTDAKGEVSNISQATGFTPKQDGSDGG